jgi:nucleoside-diphosphate-sugar epimerase
VRFTSIDGRLRHHQNGDGEPPRDYRELTADELSAYGSVVLLAAHSSVNACEVDPAGAFANNVLGFIGLVHKLRGQRLIFASTSSVYVQTGARPADEADVLPEPACAYDSHKRVIEQYVGVTYPNHYALRFGTVCGPSPNVRTDVLLNSLVWSAVKEGRVRVANRLKRRPLLGINDLCRAVEALLTAEAEPGAYNLASVNVVIGEVADYVADRFGVPTVEVESQTLYDMTISTAKFERAYKFEFRDTVPGLVDELAVAFEPAVCATK